MHQTCPDDALVDAAKDYFGLATPLAALYQQWSTADALWAQLATRFPGTKLRKYSFLPNAPPHLNHPLTLESAAGLRVLRQDPVECLFCFICSSNNNIARIALMVNRLSQRYGPPHVLLQP